MQSTVFPTAPVGYTVSGDTNCTTSGLTRTKYHFGPRLGFAYSPGGLRRFTGGPGKTSIRAGIGLSYKRSYGDIHLPHLALTSFRLPRDSVPHPTATPNFPPP